MKFKTFIGIDPSRQTFEAASLLSSSLTVPIKSVGKFDNSPEGFALFEKQLLTLGHVADSALIAIEHIGPYNEALAEYFYHKGWFVWLASPLVISKSAGELVRGKTDALDAVKICEFAARFPDKVKLFSPNADWLVSLKNLSKLRKHLIKQRTQNENYNHTNEAKAHPCLSTRKTMAKLLKELNLKITQIEKEILLICKAEEATEMTRKILTSIPGIGNVIATDLILATAAMTSVVSHRQLSVMSCSAPFPYQSGTSIKRKPRTSKMGDRKMKGNLHMGALRTTQVGQLFHEYYNHQIQAGKHHLSVINDIINKLLKLAFDLCKRCELFDRAKYLSGKKSAVWGLVMS